VNFAKLSRQSQEQNISEYLEHCDWVVHVSGDEIIHDMLELINQGFLECWKFDRTTTERLLLSDVDYKELSIYSGYNCHTFDEHIEKYSYGPHEFFITKLAREERDKPEYQEYDRQLGFSE
jgi:hypothetical protein